MDLPDILSALRRRWPLAAAALVVGTGAACTQLALAVPTYDATARLYVTVAAADSGSTTDLVQGGNAAQQRVQSYVDIITTPRVLQPAIDELGLDTTAQELSEHVRASSPNETVLLNLTVNDPSPKRAAAIANAVSDSFTRLVADDLEQSSTPDAPSPVSVRTVQPALPPVNPATPQPMKSLLLGIGGGLVAGIVAALLRDLLDTRIRGRGEVESATDRPILGTVPKNKHLQNAPVYIQGDRRGPFAEAFRALRTNLRFVDQGGTSRVVVVTSANPSEGKTTTSLNLAAALMEGGSRVAVVDCDLRRPAVADRLGIPNEAGLTDVLIGRAEIDDVLHRWGTTGSVLPTGAIPPNPADLLASPGMQAILTALAAENDYVIVDTPPLLPVTDAAILAASTAGAIVVAAAGRSHTNELRDAVAVLDQADARTLGIVVGMVKTPRSRYGYGYRGDAPELSDDDLKPVRGVRVAD
ncbi:polysaccharide biosynthesis tyrosine autokinase [Curtobacterium sp. RRHDQ66]|uniref:polysaccharide biosynthesis tyrosine autokinase n=1 Tax=Curtobacterium guangdongense TaxID=3413380 RepID=UPI003BF1F36D